MNILSFCVFAVWTFVVRTTFERFFFLCICTLLLSYLCIYPLTIPIMFALNVSILFFYLVYTGLSHFALFELSVPILIFFSWNLRLNFFSSYMYLLSFPTYVYLPNVSCLHFHTVWSFLYTSVLRSFLPCILLSNESVPVYRRFMGDLSGALLSSRTNTLSPALGPDLDLLKVRFLPGLSDLWSQAKLTAGSVSTVFLVNPGKFAPGAPPPGQQPCSALSHLPRLIRLEKLTGLVKLTLVSR